MQTLSSFFKPGLQRRRMLMTLAGVSVSGVSVAFFKQAAFGVDPFQSFCNGLHQVIPINFGTLYMLINIVMLVFSVLMVKYGIDAAKQFWNFKWITIPSLNRGPTWLCIPFCGVTSCIYLLWSIYEEIQKLKKGGEA